MIQTASANPTDFVLEQDHPDFPSTGLKRTSVFRMNKLLTINKTLIKKRLGRVSPSIQAELDHRLRIATGLISAF